MPIVVTVLAVYGWFLVTRLAQCREVQDLYSSILVLLDQINTDGQRAWEDNFKDALCEYTEKTLVYKVAGIEKRINLLGKHYKRPAKMTNAKIIELRQSLTATADFLSSKNIDDRSALIYKSTMTMTDICLDESYEYISKYRRLFFPISLFKKN